MSLNTEPSLRSNRPILPCCWRCDLAFKTIGSSHLKKKFLISSKQCTLSQVSCFQEINYSNFELSHIPVGSIVTFLGSFPSILALQFFLTLFLFLAIIFFTESNDFLLLQSRDFDIHFPSFKRNKTTRWNSIILHPSSPLLLKANRFYIHPREI